MSTVFLTSWFGIVRTWSDFCIWSRSPSKGESHRAATVAWRYTDEKMHHLTALPFIDFMGHGLQNAVSKWDWVTSPWQVSSFSSRSDKESCYCRICRWDFAILWSFCHQGCKLEVIIKGQGGGNTSSYLKTWPQLSWEQLELLDEKLAAIGQRIVKLCRSARVFISSLRLRIGLNF